MYMLQTLFSSEYLLHSKQMNLLIMDPKIVSFTKTHFISTSEVRPKGTCFSFQQHSITNPPQIVISVQQMKPSHSECSQAIFSHILKSCRI